MHPIMKSIAERNTKVRVVLKNEINVTGKLYYVDTNLNMQINDAESDSPQLTGIQKCFIRGSSVKFISISNEDCSAEYLDQLISNEGKMV